MPLAITLLALSVLTATCLAHQCTVRLGFANEAEIQRVILQTWDDFEVGQIHEEDGGYPPHSLDRMTNYVFRCFYVVEMTHDLGVERLAKFDIAFMGCHEDIIRGEEDLRSHGVTHEVINSLGLTGKEAMGRCLDDEGFTEERGIYEGNMKKFYVHLEKAFKILEDNGKITSQQASNAEQLGVDD